METSIQVKQLAGLSKRNLLTSIFHDGEFRYGKDLAEIINVSFCKSTEDILSLPREQIRLSPNTSFVDPTLYDYSISVDSVEKVLAPDSIPNWILKDFASILAPPITSIFNASIGKVRTSFLY